MKIWMKIMSVAARRLASLKTNKKVGKNSDGVDHRKDDGFCQ